MKIICKIVMAVFCVVVLQSKIWAGGIPVFDAIQESNALAQLGKMAEEISKLESQIQNQVKQIENMVMNSVSPATYVWSEADRSIQKLLDLQKKYQGLLEGSGGIDNYLKGYTDREALLEKLKNNPYNASYAREYEYNKKKIEQEKRAVEQILQQQQNLEAEAKELAKLQQNAQSAQGRMEALQYANQFASMQNEQLMAMRTLLLQEYQARHAKEEEEAAKKAAHKEMYKDLYKSTYKSESK